MQEMKNSSLRFGHNKAKFVDVMFMTGAAAGYADICSTHQARGLDAGVGRSSLLLGPIGHA